MRLSLHEQGLESSVLISEPIHRIAPVHCTLESRGSANWNRCLGTHVRMRVLGLVRLFLKTVPSCFPSKTAVHMWMSLSTVMSGLTGSILTGRLSRSLPISDWLYAKNGSGLEMMTRIGLRLQSLWP